MDRAEQTMWYYQKAHLHPTEWLCAWRLRRQDQLDDEGAGVSEGLERPGELRRPPRRIPAHLRCIFAHLRRACGLRLARRRRRRRRSPSPGPCGGYRRAPAEREAARRSHRPQVLDAAVKEEAAWHLVGVRVRLTVSTGAGVGVRARVRVRGDSEGTGQGRLPLPARGCRSVHGCRRPLPLLVAGLVAPAP